MDIEATGWFCLGIFAVLVVWAYFNSESEDEDAYDRHLREE